LVQNGFMNITVKNVPESVYRAIKREAKRNRRSLNAKIVQALETEAAEAGRRRQFSDLRKELERFAATFVLDGSVAALGASTGHCRGLFGSVRDAQHHGPWAGQSL